MQPFISFCNLGLLPQKSYADSEIREPFSIRIWEIAVHISPPVIGQMMMVWKRMRRGVPLSVLLGIPASCMSNLGPSM